MGRVQGEGTAFTSPQATHILLCCGCNRNIKCSLLQRNGERVLEVRGNGWGIRLQAKPFHVIEKEL